jgi:hypothetical protein
VFNFLKNLFSTKHIGTEKDKIYDWLSSSSSLEEIERRQRMLSRGEAPWQVRANQNLKGWI